MNPVRKNFFIIFICMFLQAVPFGIAQNIQPLFIPYVIEEFNFSLAAFSLIFTVGALAAAVFAPFFSKLFDKINIKIIFIIGASLSSLGFLAFGFADSLLEFYFYSAVLQIGCAIFSGLGVPYVINHWFPQEGRGKALGIAFAGGSIGNIFLQSITSHMLASKGIAYSYILFGIVALISSLPVILLFIRLPKEGEVKSNDEKMKATEVSELKGPGIAEIKKNLFFWIFGTAFAIISVSISALSTQYATYFTGELKMSSALVGMLGSVFALFCLFGNILGGYLFDKIGSFKTMTISFVLQTIAIIALLFAKNIYELAFLFSIAYGLNVFSYMSAPAFMASDVFGKRDSNVKLAIIKLFFAIGFALGSTLFGAVTDHFGFSMGWIMLLGCTVLGYCLLLIAIGKVKKQRTMGSQSRIGGK